MTWLEWLGLALVITAVAAITGISPRGGRHVAGTRMMGVARIALLAFIVICVAAYVFVRVRSGG